MILAIFYFFSLYGGLVGINRLYLENDNGDLTKSRLLFWNQFNPFALLILKRIRRRGEYDKLKALENKIHITRRVLIEKMISSPKAEAEPCQNCMMVPITTCATTVREDWMRNRSFFQLECSCKGAGYGTYILEESDAEKRPALLDEGMGSLRADAEFIGRCKDLLIMNWNKNPNMKKRHSEKVVSYILQELDSM